MLIICFDAPHTSTSYVALRIFGGTNPEHHKSKSIQHNNYCRTFIDESADAKGDIYTEIQFGFLSPRPHLSEQVRVAVEHL